MNAGPDKQKFFGKASANVKLLSESKTSTKTQSSI